MYGGGIKKLLSFNPKPAAAFVRSEVIRQIKGIGVSELQEGNRSGFVLAQK